MPRNSLISSGKLIFSNCTILLSSGEICKADVFLTTGYIDGVPYQKHFTAEFYDNNEATDLGKFLKVVEPEYNLGQWIIQE